jgi:hypothetical protein
MLPEIHLQVALFGTNLVSNISTKTPNSTIFNANANLVHILVGLGISG